MATTFADPQAFLQQLARFNATRVALGTPSAQWQDELRAGFSHQLAEGHYLETLRAEVAPMMMKHANGGDYFIGWFESLAHIGPGQQHPLFDWLAENATLPQMLWFLAQEAEGEAGFGDLVDCRLTPSRSARCEIGSAFASNCMARPLRTSLDRVVATEGDRFIPILVPNTFGKPSIADQIIP